MLPHVLVRSAQEEEYPVLEELVDTIGPQCVCDRGGQKSIVFAQTLVAVQSGIVIGFVSWLQDEMQAVVVGLGVGGNYRRFGVAALLVKELVVHLREAGLRLLEVFVGAEDVGAIGVFRSTGFRQLDAGARVAFELRLCGQRNRTDGFSLVTLHGIY